MPPAGIALDQVTVPALICASWSDHGLHTRGSFEAHKQIRSEQEWMWNHGRAKWDVFYSDEAIAAQQQFFDHFLKGEDNGMGEVRSIRLEVRESFTEYRVRYEDEWPRSRRALRGVADRADEAPIAGHALERILRRIEVAHRVRRCNLGSAGEPLQASSSAACSGGCCLCRSPSSSPRRRSSKHTIARSAKAAASTRHVRSRQVALASGAIV